MLIIDYFNRETLQKKYPQKRYLIAREEKIITTEEGKKTCKLSDTFIEELGQYAPKERITNYDVCQKGRYILTDLCSNESGSIPAIEEFEKKEGIEERLREIIAKGDKNLIDYLQERRSEEIHPVSRDIKNAKEREWLIYAPCFDVEIRENESPFDLSELLQLTLPLKKKPRNL